MKKRMKKMLRGVLLLFSSAMIVLTLSGVSSTSQNVMLFVIGDIPEAYAQTGPTTCTGTNYTTGNTNYTQLPYITGSRSYCPGVYACNSSTPSSCVNPVTGATMKPNEVCRVGMYSAGSGGLVQRALPLNVIDCARSALPWRFTQPAGGQRMPNIGADIDGATGCWVEYRWNQQSLGVGIPSLQCGQSPTVDFNSGSNSNGNTSTGNSTGGEERESSGQGGNSATTRAFSPVGRLEKAGSRISGWVIDLSSISSPVKVRVYVGSAFIGEYTADKYRPDIGSQLSQVEGINNHGFDIATPSGHESGEVVYVYAVNPSGGTNPEIGRKTLGTSDSVTSADFFAPYIAALTNGARSGSGISNAITNAPQGPTQRASNAFQQISICRDPNQGFGGIRCPFTPQDGGQTCEVFINGGLSSTSDRTCMDRFNACSTEVRGWNGNAFCDPIKYAYCREAEVFDAPGRGTLDYIECDRMLLEGGCRENPQTCNMREILGLDRTAGDTRDPIDRSR